MKKHLDFILSILSGFFVIGSLQYFNKGFFSDPDGFYHAKVSQLLAHGQLTDNFIWLPLTTWGKNFADQHYLYHILLIPFNNIHLLPLSVFVFCSIALTFFLILLKKLNVPGLLFWTLLFLLGSIDFTFRINLIKANTLSLALMIITILLLIYWDKRKSWTFATGLALTGFVFVWSYGGFVFIPVIAGIYGLSILIYKKKIEYIPVISLGLGIILGLFLHPHSEHLFNSLSNQLFQTGLRAGSVVPAGNEWLPYNLDWFIKSDILILFVWIFSLAISIKKLLNKELDWITFWLQTVTCIFLIFALWHRRFIEYFIPFAVLGAAISFAPYLRQINKEKLLYAFRNGWQFRFVGLVVLLIFGYVLNYNYQQVSPMLNGGDRGDLYKEAAQAMAGASQPGDMVLNTQWDQFPQLWYWNSKNYYMVGMDPTFFYISNPEKYWLWRKIADDNPDDWSSGSEVHDIIKNQLNSKFVFVQIDRNPDIVDFMDKYPEDFEAIYEQNNIAVYKVL